MKDDEILQLDEDITELSVSTIEKIKIISRYEFEQYNISMFA